LKLQTGQYVGNVDITSCKTSKLTWLQNEVKVHVLNYKLGLRNTNFGQIEQDL